MTYATARRSRNWRRFALHYVEMVIAMFAGMGIFAALEAGVSAITGLGYSQEDQPVLAATLMAAYMSAGMIIWMRIRGHSWPGILEMSGVMFVPVAVLAPLVWAGVVAGETLFMATHVAMFPLMLVAMLRRRDEYAGAHA
jgi:hypothetical protein